MPKGETSRPTDKQMKQLAQNASPGTLGGAMKGLDQVRRSRADSDIAAAGRIRKATQEKANKALISETVGRVRRGGKPKGY